MVAVPVASTTLPIGLISAATPPSCCAQARPDGKIARASKRPARPATVLRPCMRLLPSEKCPHTARHIYGRSAGVGPDCMPPLPLFSHADIRLTKFRDTEMAYFAHQHSKK